MRRAKVAKAYRRGGFRRDAWDVPSRNGGAVEVDALSPWGEVFVESFRDAGENGIATMSPARARKLAAVLLVAADMAEKGGGK